MSAEVIARDLLQAAGDYDTALEALEDWTDGPFRPSDHSPAVRRVLKRVTPTNADAVLDALDVLVDTIAVAALCTPCEGCGAEAGEVCRPDCLGRATVPAPSARCTVCGAESEDECMCEDEGYSPAR